MMNSEINTALAISLIQQKPVGMDTVDYVTSVQSKVLEKESELFFKEFLCESESNQSSNHHQSLREILNIDSLNFEDLYTSPGKKLKLSDCEVLITNDYSPNLFKKFNKCLVQPVITMQILNENTKTPIDSGYNTINWKEHFENTSQTFIRTMSQSIQEALDILTYTLFDRSKLLNTVINWYDRNNLVRYFVEMVASKAKSNEFGFTCGDNVTLYVQNTSLKILNDHHLYHSIQVEYQCNLIATFCYDKHIRWNVIHLLLNHLKSNIEAVNSNHSLRSIFYTFYLIDKLICDVDFHSTNEVIKNQNSITDLWKTNYKNKSEVETEAIELMLKEWINVLEYISMETLRKNVFLVSIRAHQCLEALKLFTSPK